MPKAVQKGTRSSKAKPYSKKVSAKDGSVLSKPRTGKDSHLYTDDNPATTLHGTGFANEAKALHTIELVSKRSLTYQFQTINTMYHRAKHHPSSNDNIKAAIKIFEQWLTVTYPARKREEPQRKLLAKDVIEKCLPLLRAKVSEDDILWAEKYIKLERGKRLANTLMDDSKPGEADMEVIRQQVLKDLVGTGKGKAYKEELWLSDGSLQPKHARCLAYAINCCSIPELMRHVEPLLERLEDEKR